MAKNSLNSAETHSKHDKYNAKNPPCKTYGFLIYPESVDPNFRQIISENFDGSWALSPLHDSDITENGEPKKAHHHGIIAFDKKQRPSAVKKLLELVEANPFAIAYTNNKRVRGAYEYFTHKNNPEKAQYSETDIELFKGFDINDFMSLKELKAKDRQLLKDIQKFVKDNGIIYYCDLLDYCMEHNDRWYELLTEKYTYIVREYMKSYAVSIEKGYN